MTILPWTHAIADMPSSGRDYTRQASPEECAALSADLGLLACQDVSAAYTIRAIGGGRYRLTGTVEAHVTQSCVVTLEPLKSHVKLPIDVTFSPDTSAAPPALEDGDIEVSTLPEVEPIENSALDTGRVVFEALATGIDPYPKKADAAFAWNDPRATDSSINPFAVLAKLKSKT